MKVEKASNYRLVSDPDIAKRLTEILMKDDFVSPDMLERELRSLKITWP